MNKPSQKDIDHHETLLRKLRVDAEFADARKSLRLAKVMEDLEKERDRWIAEVKSVQ